MIPRTLRTLIKKRERELVEEIIRELRKRSDVVITAPADDPAEQLAFHVKREEESDEDA